MEVQGSGQISRNKNENTKGKSLTNVLPNFQTEGGRRAQRRFEQC